MSHYSKLLKDDRIKTKRRERLNDSFDAFVVTRFDTFWSNWELKVELAETQKKLGLNAATVAKKTAIMAQTASLHESEQSFALLSSHRKAKGIPPTVTNDEKVSESDGEFPDDEETPTIVVPQSGARSSPFYDLITYVFESSKGKDTVLPSTVPKGLSKILREIYRSALKELQTPGPAVHKKDALVLLSTIINTVAPSGRRFSLSKHIMTASLLPRLDYDSDQYISAKDLLADLLQSLHPRIGIDRYCPPELGRLKKRVWRLLCDTAENTTTSMILQIVNQITLWIELGMFVSPTSEHVYVSAWSMIFNILLLGTNIRAIPGELASKSTARERQRTERVFGSTTSTPCGRKVDLSIRIKVDNEWKTEIAAFEFKSSTAGLEICERQQKKSVRLNAAILLGLEARGLDITKSFPVIAEGQALHMNFYTLRRFGEVLGAGRSTTNGIFLPSQVEDLKSFFQSDTITTLLSLKEHLRRYAADVTDALATSVVSPFGPISDNDTDDSDDDEDDDDGDNDAYSPFSFGAQPSTPPPKKRCHAYVLFSPSKREKKAKNDNSDFEENTIEEYD
ncbi:hypothetical protein BGZ83_002531 [Gryganskiella cystojenkinii]|nr:hypothetical protein BGZ83_002531 [Gryganskiella cystojenkinii]